MDSCILFSPVGGHDPIAGDHDGALLHICRKYRPEKVYLYLSHEMAERSRQDDRYRASLNKLGEHLGCRFEIQQIERDELTKVQLFDAFYEEFEGIIHQIHQENPESRLLLNLSSGTPAMKSALNIIATLAPYPMHPIQVSTPHERENPKREDPKDYDVELFWACNEDNAPQYKDRCKETGSSHLMAKIKKESILRLMDAFDYKAALMLAQDIREFLPVECLRLLEAAVCRLELDGSGYAKAMKGLPRSFIPITDGGQRQIFEYLLQLKVRQEQGNYCDFIRGLTPVVLDLFEMCLRSQLSMDIRDFCEKRKKGDDYVYYISEPKMEGSDQGKKVLCALQSGYGCLYLRQEPYKSSDIFYIFNAMSQDSELIADMEKLREIESKVRNVAAHEIISVTDAWIERRVGINSAQIMKLLRRMAGKAGLRAKPQDWDSYRDMNCQIAETLRFS